MADNDVVSPSCGNVFADLDLPDAEALLVETDFRIAASDCACADGVVCRRNNACPRLVRRIAEH